MYSAWKTANSKLNLTGKSILVLGGTQGIGAGVATRFAQLGASVAIAGRNEKVATDMIENWKKESKNLQEQEFRFFKVDCSSVKDIVRFTDEVQKYYESKGGLTHLIQSQGYLQLTAQTNTSEGLDEHFTVTAYAKWLITKRLISVVQDSCMYLLHPVTAGGLDLNDPEIRSASAAQRVKKNKIFVDAITKEFQKKYEKIRFYHLFPGIVSTDIMKNSGYNRFLNGIEHLLGTLFGRTPQVYSDLPVYLAEVRPPEWPAGSRFTEKGIVLNDYEWISSDDNRSKLFDWCDKQEHRILNDRDVA